MIANVRASEYGLLASICRESFYEFVREFWDEEQWGKPVWNWHIEYLCDELQDAAELVFQNLPREQDIICNVPPGTTKSTIFSVMFPAWVWTRMPNARFICASHAFDLSLDLSQKCRDIIQSEKYQACFPLKLRDDQNTKGLYKNTRGGYRLSCTVGGKNPTGFHGHFLIVDDPIDPQKAKLISGLDVKTANDFMTETLSQRKADKKVTVMFLVMQRLHQNDPSGYLLRRDKGKNRIKHICLPAEDSDLVCPARLRKKYIDGLMDPVRLSERILDEQRSLGDYFYSGQYMQSPVPLGGGMFKVARLHPDDFPTNPGDWKKLVRYWDKAGTKDAGAKTAGVKMGIDHLDRIWILHCVKGQWEAREREAVIDQTAKLDTVRTHIGHEQEPGSGGKESAQATTRRLGLMGYHVKEDKVTGDKVLRADPLAVQVNAGNVYLAKGDWNADYLDEMTFFPMSTNKDQIDASSGAFAMLTKPRIKVRGL